MILGSIEQDIPVHELLHLAALGSGELELIEALLQPSSPAVGRNARDIPLPEGCAIFAVIRDDVAISVRADTVLAEGDKVIAIGKTRVPERPCTSSSSATRPTRSRSQPLEAERLVPGFRVGSGVSGRSWFHGGVGRSWRFIAHKLRKRRRAAIRAISGLQFDS